MNPLAYPIYEVKPGSYVYRVPSSLSRDECLGLVDFFEENHEHHYDGITGMGHNPELKSTRDISFKHLVEQGGIYKEVDDLLFNSLNNGLEQLRELLGVNFTPEENPTGADFQIDYGYMFSRYDEGGFYTWHHDGGNHQNRQLTALWYLNDIPKEAGGRTLFHDQGIEVQPKAGDLMLFPANWTHVHKAEPVKFGSKYIATTWIC